MTSNCEQQLVEDYQRLFRDDLLTDFTIRVCGREIKAHRAILAARSPVFQAMLMHEDTNETKSGVLEICDLDYDVVYEMVYYIYCGRCQREISDIASDLLIAADKYRLEELKRAVQVCQYIFYFLLKIGYILCYHWYFSLSCSALNISRLLLAGMIYLNSTHNWLLILLITLIRRTPQVVEETDCCRYLLKANLLILLSSVISS
uniref:BTB domain-containing protein n=1 Tax=Heterorhabditis bacteriophora TaxID=37862 RepID=A0A1I7X095_HETBA